MENSVISTIGKIKLQEIEKEAKLKEIREYETTLASLNRAIREANLQYEKFVEEEAELLKRTDNLRSELEIEKIRRNAYSMQMEACFKEFEELRNKVDEGISKVWDQRSSLCNEVQNASDKCDVWTLLIRPTWTDLSPKPIKKPENSVENSIIEDKLKKALERRDKAISERKRLMAEPDEGEEFIRIKNALRYSSEMVENLQRQQS
ncbi:uncharacterized protein LOC128199964 [Galleria mellonella]|uniref:Uncharacterized protein LOC128199964 n=1 Tax=Galleria mellonella TaxID=7137 RepID=A0ABM3N6Z9_GALME|nr:uncharacterized protein LOC128199964 [Galleria mellonella]